MGLIVVMVTVGTVGEPAEDAFIVLLTGTFDVYFVRVDVGYFSLSLSLSPSLSLSIFFYYIQSWYEFYLTAALMDSAARTFFVPSW